MPATPCRRVPLCMLTLLNCSRTEVSVTTAACSPAFVFSYLALRESTWFFDSLCSAVTSSLCCEICRCAAVNFLRSSFSRASAASSWE